MVYSLTYRPMCINEGCNTPAAYGKTNQSGGKRYRPFCSACHDADYGRRPYKPGVKPFKKRRCNNEDGKLGFLCPTDFSKIPPWAKGVTQIDHIDGDRNNWAKENIQELCCSCHPIKTGMYGDTKGNPRSHIIPATTNFDRFFPSEGSISF